MPHNKDLKAKPHPNKSLNQPRRRFFLKSSIATITAATTKTVIFPIQNPNISQSMLSPSSNHLLRCNPTIANAYETLDNNNNDDDDVSFLSSPKRRDFPYNKEWVGTSLSLLSITSAAAYATQSQQQQEGGETTKSATTFPMGRWPDPMLRRPANLIPSQMWNTKDLKVVAETLRDTARFEGAVGLAAQQCGIDGSLVFLDDDDDDDNGGNDGELSTQGQQQQGKIRKGLATTNSSKGRRSFLPFGALDQYEPKMVVMGEGDAEKGKLRNSNEQNDERKGGGIFLVNPRIIARSSEVNMKVWTEQCLVLPPDFTATVLRDDQIIVEYETLEGQTRTIKLGGELSRAAQHEMDHDRGVLIVDHVSLDEMSNDVMRILESRGHEERMVRAYERYMSDSVVDAV